MVIIPLISTPPLQFNQDYPLYDAENAEIVPFCFPIMQYLSKDCLFVYTVQDCVPIFGTFFDHVLYKTKIEKITKK